MSFSSDIVRRTYFWDRIRGAGQGVLETGYMGLTLVIAIQVFDASYEVKGLIAAANPLGLLMTPITLSIFAWLNRPANQVAATMMFISGLCMLASAFSHSITGYLYPLLLSFVAFTQAVPMMAHIYAENYPPNKRGTYLSTSFMISVAATLGFSYLFGHLMDLSTGYYRLILLSLCAANFVVALAIYQIPSTPVSKKETQNPIQNLGYAFSDGKFGFMLLGWTFAGLGNLMVMPIRFEYLLQPEYGIETSTLNVAWLTLGLPAICRFISVKFWGKLFDSMDIMILRSILSAMQMIAIVLFFSTRNLWIIGIASVLYGLSMGGGNLAWSLWVTKFAPPERTAAYMSVHTFLTGVRGFAAPFLGFYFLIRYGSIGTGGIGGGMILVSIFLMMGLFFVTRAKASRSLP